MKLSGDDIAKQYDNDDLFQVEVTKKKYATTLVFRGPKLSEITGPFEAMAQKDSTHANTMLLKALCLSHEPAELDVIWENVPAAYVLSSKALLGVLNEGAAETKKGVTA